MGIKINNKENSAVDVLNKIWNEGLKGTRKKVSKVSK